MVKRPVIKKGFHSPYGQMPAQYLKLRHDHSFQAITNSLFTHHLTLDAT